MPQRIVWAWERPEDLRFLEAKKFGVAFLAQTLFVTGDGIDPKPRRQPLQVNPGTYMIAVTRIETNKASHPAFRRPAAADRFVGQRHARTAGCEGHPDRFRTRSFPNVHSTGR